MICYLKDETENLFAVNQSNSGLHKSESDLMHLDLCKSQDFPLDHDQIRHVTVDSVLLDASRPKPRLYRRVSK